MPYILNWTLRRRSCCKPMTTLVYKNVLICWSISNNSIQTQSARWKKKIQAIIKLIYTILFKLIAKFNSFLFSYQSTEEQNSWSKLLQNATKKWKILTVDSSWNGDKHSNIVHLLVVLPVMAIQTNQLGPQSAP